MKIAVTSFRQEVRPVADWAGDIDASWAQFGDELLIWTDDDRSGDVIERARSAELSIDERADIAHSENLHLVIQVGRTFQQEHPDARVIVDKGRFLVVEIDAEKARHLPGRDEVCYQVSP